MIREKPTTMMLRRRAGGTLRAAALDTRVTSGVVIEVSFRLSHECEVNVFQARLNNLEPVRLSTPTVSDKRRYERCRLERALLALNATGVYPPNNRGSCLWSAEFSYFSRIDNAPTEDDRGAVTKLGGLVKVVSCEQDRCPLILEIPDELPEFLPCLGIKAGCWFIEKEELWPTNDAQGDTPPPPLPAGEFRDPGCRLRLQSDRSDDIFDPAGIGI